MDTKRAFARDDGMEAAPGRHVRAAGIRVWVAEGGPPDGRAIMLVHGLAAHGVIWRRVLPTLVARGLRVVVPDLPGHGQSDGKRHRATYSPRFFSRALLDVADALGIERLSVVGNSLGGVVAARMALAVSHRVTRLVLMNSAGLSPEGVPWSTRLLYAPFALSSVVGMTPSPFWTRLFLQRAVVADPAQAAELAEALGHHPPLPAAVRRSARALLGPDGRIAKDLAALPVPTLFIWGEADIQFPVALAEAMARRMPHGGLARLAGVGHVPHWEAPEAVASLLAAFVLAGDGEAVPAVSLAARSAGPDEAALRLRPRRTIGRKRTRGGPPTSVR